MSENKGELSGVKLKWVCADPKCIAETITESNPKGGKPRPYPKHCDKSMFFRGVVEAGAK